MAVTRIVGSRYYVGLSGDAKPENPLVGTIFYETDTKNVYRFHGSSWDELPAIPMEVSALEKLNVRKLGDAIKAVDSEDDNYTSDAIDCREYNGLFTLTYDEGSWNGVISVQGAMGTGEVPETDFGEFGASLSVKAGAYKAEVFENVFPFIRVNAMRTGGAVSVWVQPFYKR